jgi:hypothetical protein
MKHNKILALSLILVLVLSTSLTACKSKKKETNEGQNETIETASNAISSNDGSMLEGDNLEGLTFNSEEVTFSEELNQAIYNSGLTGQYTKAVTFDLNITDSENNKVQPDGTVTITKTLEDLNAPEGYSTEFKVYYFNPETLSLEECPTSFEGNTVKFETTHFSWYTYFYYCFDRDKNVVTNILETEDGLKFYTAKEYADYIIEKDFGNNEVETSASNSNTIDSNNNSTNNTSNNSNNNVEKETTVEEYVNSLSVDELFRQSKLNPDLETALLCYQRYLELKREAALADGCVNVINDDYPNSDITGPLHVLPSQMHETLLDGYYLFYNTMQSTIYLATYSSSDNYYHFNNSTKNLIGNSDYYQNNPKTLRTAIDFSYVPANCSYNDFTTRLNWLNNHGFNITINDMYIFGSYNPFFPDNCCQTPSQEDLNRILGN